MAEKRAQYDAAYKARDWQQMYALMKEMRNW